MTIETSKYFFNKNMHVELATELNILASQKNVQVSRWVNNSKNHQIVTYVVHTGERNDYASKQEGVLFEISEDAGRNNKITDETDMMAAVRKFLNNIVVETAETAETTTYKNICDRYGSNEFVTVADYQELNSDATFKEDWYGIYEYNAEGEFVEQVAELAS